jgi:hypothetical protein
MKVINDYEYRGQIIELQAGDTVQLGERSNPDGPYPNWIHCESDKTGKGGWVAIGILTVTGNTAVVNEDYTSEEMTVSTDDIVDTLYELNGWYWCRRLSDSKEAWVDKGNLQPFTA